MWIVEKLKDTCKSSLEENKVKVGEGGGGGFFCAEKRRLASSVITASAPHGYFGQILKSEEATRKIFPSISKADLSPESRCDTG